MINAPSANGHEMVESPICSGTSADSPLVALFNADLQAAALGSGALLCPLIGKLAFFLSTSFEKYCQDLNRENQVPIREVTKFLSYEHQILLIILTLSPSLSISSLKEFYLYKLYLS